MALDFLRVRLPSSRSPRPPGAVGEPDAHVFNCPTCARPLSEGTPRCPGCGTRLIMGVKLRRAMTLMGFGFAIGALVGGAVTSSLISTIVRPTAPPAIFDDVTPSVPPATGVPSLPQVSLPPVVSKMPVTAATALRQAADLDGRLATDAAALRASLSGSGADMARALRAISSDASIGLALVPGLRTWPDAATLADKREAFYNELATVARDGLRDSVTERKRYKATVNRMLSKLKAVPDLDATSREFAAAGGLVLPPISLGVLAR